MAAVLPFEKHEARLQQPSGRASLSATVAGTAAGWIDTDQSFLTTMVGNLLLMSFALSAILTATLRAIAL